MSSISNISSHPVSHVQAFGLGGYTFSPNSPLIEKIAVVANYIFSIVMPLYPITAFLICALLDRCNHLSNELPSEPVTSNNSCDSFNEIDTDVSPFHSQTNPDLLADVTNQQRTDVNTTLLQTLADGNLLSLKALRDPVLIARLKRLPHSKLLAIALSDQASPARFRAIHTRQGPWGISISGFNSIKEVFINDLNNGRLRQGENRWQRQVDLFKRFSGATDEMFPRDQTTEEFFNAVVANADQLHQNITSH
jgi:hypothetical protein